MRNGHIAGILITISTNMILIECLSMYGFSFQNHMAKTSRHLVFSKYGPQKFKDHIRRFTSSQSFRRSRITMMPEGPEVKTLVDQLQGGVGMLFRGIEFCSGRYVRHGPPKGYEAFLSTLDKDSDIIEEWNCKGKFIYLILNQGEIGSKSTRSPEDFQRSIWITLGMSGRFVSNKLLTSEKSETRWILHLADRFEPANTHTILYHDPRNFGTLNFCLSAADLRTKLNSLGPDILNSSSTNEELFLQIIAKQRSKNDMNICQFLMNQKKISGIGNYLLAEGLYRAKIDPFCSLTELSEDQQRYLLRELQATALESYDRQGLTRRAGGSYRDVQGNRGSMESMLQCYGRTTCSRGMPVIQEINGPHGRTIWYTEEQLFRPRSQRSTCSPTDDEDFSDKDVSPMKESVTKSSQHLDPLSGSVKYSKPRLSPSEVSTESSNTRLMSSGQAEVISDLASFLIDESWRDALSSTFQSKEIFELTDFLRKEKERNAIVYPPENEIFAALNLCPLQDVKVVIVGQDPYHGPGQSHGLSFSVRRGIRPPPSLQNIFLEAQSDVGICKPNHGDLTCWVQQGVLLLNSVLTVRAGEANSHPKKGWEVVTDAIIKTLNEERNGLVFLLWGNPAHLKASNVDETRHTVIRTSHPSPLGAMKTNSPFLGSKCFSQTNEALEKYGKKVIDWSIQ